MTQDGEFKKIVRERMAITGENYTRALRAVLAAAQAAVPQPDGEEQPAEAPDRNGQ